MPQTLKTLSETPSQTAGPYVQIGCTPTFAGLNNIYSAQDVGLNCIEDGACGKQIIIRGHVFDNQGNPMFDPMIESWQADTNGLFAGQAGADPKVNGFCRFPLDKSTGEFTLHTIKPGRIIFDDTRYQAPHIALWIVARGNNIGLNTRVYFDDEDNSKDPVLLRVQPEQRIETLIAQQISDSEYRFDIHLRGNAETVFFDM
ncbi:MAG: protocatechuate 3,4-dioxygenase subunit alpha [Granulosicoccus sp.]